MYRTYEAITHYGEAMKMLINEQVCVCVCVTHTHCFVWRVCTCLHECMHVRVCVCVCVGRNL